MRNNVQERLDKIRGNYFSQVKDEFRIIETSKEGEADIRCSIAGKALCFRLEGGQLFSYLQNHKCADAIILENIEEDRWKLYIVECKRQVKLKEWQKAKEQFEGALLRALAISGILGISEFAEVKCYTAFRIDALSPEESADPYVYEEADRAQREVADHTDSEIDEWLQGKISVLFYPEIEHQKIVLDPETGVGEILFC